MFALLLFFQVSYVCSALAPSPSPPICDSDVNCPTGQHYVKKDAAVDLNFAAIGCNEIGKCSPAGECSLCISDDDCGTGSQCIMPPKLDVPFDNCCVGFRVRAHDCNATLESAYSWLWDCLRKAVSHREQCWGSKFVWESYRAFGSSEFDTIRRCSCACVPVATTTTTTTTTATATTTTTTTTTTLPPTSTPTAMPMITPTAMPITPTAMPITPTAMPITPTAMPITPTLPPPTAMPITPTAMPITPTAMPITPTAMPITPTAMPITPTLPPSSASPTPSPIAPSPPTIVMVTFRRRQQPVLEPTTPFRYRESDHLRLEGGDVEVQEQRNDLLERLLDANKKRSNPSAGPLCCSAEVTGSFSDAQDNSLFPSCGIMQLSFNATPLCDFSSPADFLRRSALKELVNAEKSSELQPVLFKLDCGGECDEVPPGPLIPMDESPEEEEITTTTIIYIGSAAACCLAICGALIGFIYIPKRKKKKKPSHRDTSPSASRRSSYGKGASNRLSRRSRGGHNKEKDGGGSLPLAHAAAQNIPRWSNSNNGVPMQTPFPITRPDIQQTNSQYALRLSDDATSLNGRTSSQPYDNAFIASGSSGTETSVYNRSQPYDNAFIASGSSGTETSVYNRAGSYGNFSNNNTGTSFSSGGYVEFPNHS